MPLSADDVLRNAETVIYLLETTLPNSIPHAWDMKDHAGGDTPLGCSSDTSVYRSNSFVRLSTETVKNGKAIPIVISGVTINRKLGEPFQGSGATLSIARMQILNNRTNDPDFDAQAEQLLSDLSDRRFKGRDVTIKVGGLLYKGTPDELDMAYDDFVTLIDGKFKSHSLNNTIIDVSIEPRQVDLKGLIPTAKYEAGKLTGQAKPLGFGQYLDFPCKDLGKGLWQFHDEVFTSADTTYSKTNYPPYAYFGYGKIFAGTTAGVSNFGIDYFATPTYALDDSGYITLERPDIDYTQSGAQQVTVAGAYPATISIDGDDVELVANADHSFNIKRVAGEGLKTFSQGNFRWSQESTTKAENFAEPKCVFEMDGDCNFDPVQGVRRGAVRVRANGTGTCTWTFAEKIANARMIIRAVRNPIQSVSSISPPAETIIPAFDSDPHNHMVIFHDIDSDTISFDYTATNDAFIMAVWFESITTYKPLEAKLTLAFDDLISKLDLAVFETNGISINNINASHTTAGTYPKIATITEEFETLNVDLQVNYGSTQVWLDNGKISERTYGTFLRDDKIYMKPNPEETYDPGDGTITRGGSCFAELNTTQDFQTKFLYRLRLAEADGEQTAIVRVEGEVGYTYKELIIGNEIRNVEIFRPTSLNDDTQSFLSFDRGEVPVDRGNANPDKEIALEVEMMAVVEANPIEGDVVGIVTVNNVDVRLPSYRVDNVGNFSDLPEGIFLWDTSGLCLASEKYTSVRADVDLGDIKAIPSFRKISLLATGEDQITTDILDADDFPVGFVLDKQTDWIKPVGEYCNGLDYYWYENLVGNGITIKDRWKLGDPVSGTIHKNLIKNVSRTNSAARQNQYIVEYQKNYSDATKTRTAQSSIGYLGEADPVIIPTILVNRDDALTITNQIGRDSIENDLWSVELTGIGHGILEGQAWFIDNHRMPKKVPCLIREMNENGESKTPNTRLSVKILRTD